LKKSVVNKMAGSAAARVQFGARTSEMGF